MDGIRRHQSGRRDCISKSAGMPPDAAVGVDGRRVDTRQDWEGVRVREWALSLAEREDISGDPTPS